jgi:hypothetical protein
MRVLCEQRPKSRNARETKRKRVTGARNLFEGGVGRHVAWHVAWRHKNSLRKKEL